MKRLDNDQKLIHDQIREAMQQYREADEMIKTFEDAMGKNEILNKQLESAIKGLEKEKIRLEKQMLKKTEEQIKIMDQAGIQLVSTDYLAGSYIEELIKRDTKYAGKDPKNMDNIKLTEILNEAKDNFHSNHSLLNSGIEKGQEVKATAKEIADNVGKTMDTVTAEAKLEVNRAKLSFMHQIEKTAHVISQQFDRMDNWRKAHGLTFKDINDALSADRAEFKEKFADKWKDIKTEFSSLANDVTYSINRHKDFVAVQQMEAERQMNMKIISVHNRSINTIDKKIDKIVKQREKLVYNLNRASRASNKLANKLRGKVGFEEKEPNLADVKKCKLFDEKIVRLEKERMAHIKSNNQLIAQNIQITNQEKEYSKDLIDRARQQAKWENQDQTIAQIGKIKISKKAFTPISDLKETKDGIEAEGHYGNTIANNMKNMAETVKQNAMTPIDQTVYNIKQMVPDEQTREYIIDISTDEHGELDLDKALALAMADRAELDIYEYTAEHSADDINMDIENTIHEDQEKNAQTAEDIETYVGNVEKMPDRAVEIISKDVINKEKDQYDKDVEELVDVMKNDEILDADGKQVNLYIVELTPEQNKAIMDMTIKQGLKTENERDHEFMMRAGAYGNPTFADFTNRNTGYKVFTRPSDAVRYADVVKRNTGLDIKMIGNTELAKSWLNRMAEKERFQNISSKDVDQNVRKVESMDQMNKTVKFAKKNRDNDDLCL
jgi:hypothetical protein